jgi:hypothetical protein
VKVRTFPVACACMSATTSDESMPPDRNAPSGTSAIMRSATDSLRRRSSSSTASRSSPSNGCASPALATPPSVQ